MTARRARIRALAGALVVLAPAAAAGGEVSVGNGTLEIGGLLQFWLQDDFTHGRPSEARVRRAEFKAAGKLTERVGWFLMIDPAQVKEDGVSTARFLTSTGGASAPAVTTVGRMSILQDLGIRYHLAGGPLACDVQVGQFKVPFGMEGLQSSSRLDFAERALMSTALKWGDVRDLGGQVRLAAGPMEVRGGVFNGEGPNRSDATQHKTANIRATARPAGWIQLGAAYQGGRLGKADALHEHTGIEMAVHLPAGVPVRLTGEYAFGVASPAGRATGVRTGYGTVVLNAARPLELAARFDWMDPDRGRAGDWVVQATGGLTWWFGGAADTRLQVNYVWNDESAPKRRNDVVRMNVQVSF